MCFNPVKSWQLGWYSDQTKTVVPPTNGHERVRMVGVDDYGKDKSEMVVVKINDGNKKLDFYIGYNRAAGRNEETMEGGDSLWVGQRPQGTAYETSKLLNKLNPLGTHTINNFRGSGKNLIIRFSSESGGKAIVDIYYSGNDPNPCSSTQMQLEIDLTTDNYGEETSWTLKSDDGREQFAAGSGYNSNQNYRISKCLPKNKAFYFEIKDSYGDGICCSEGNGKYILKKNGNVIKQGGSFGFNEVKHITT